jgi:hypothetical protein
MEPIPTNGNPLVALAVAVIKAILYVLDSIRSLATWLTITLPGYVHECSFRMRGAHVYLEASRLKLCLAT